jgi:predicted transcriptional regulator
LSLVKTSARIVAAYLETNRVAVGEIPSLIASVQAALRALGEAPAETAEASGRPTAAQVKRSIRPDGLVSFLDGRTYSTLKRHLTTHGLTPAAYRERFGLPDAYPMVAADYSARRSELARAAGLGKKPAAKTRGRRAAKA